MSILGPIVKGGIKLLHFITGRKKDATDEQRAVLRELLQTAKDTEFGKHYRFDRILRSRNPEKMFRKLVPIHHYEKIHSEWWKKLHDGAENITWPGRPHYFALSSGTTGKSSKRIPVTDDMLKAFKKTGIRQVAALSNYDLPTSFFEKEVMMLGSSSNLTYRDGHYEGEISGITTGNLPFWFKGYYKPGEEISSLEDFDERIDKIARNAKNWDIGSLSGIPSWMELMLKRVMEYHDAKDIHEVWPNLQVFTSGGVAFEPYEKSFRSLLGKPVHVINTYLASEGFLAYGDEPGSLDMKLITDSGVYFEFVPFRSEYIDEDGGLKANVPTYNLREVNDQEDYVLLISTCSGLWRYSIGDTIRFTDVRKQRIRITGRTKFFLNVEGSQLSVNKMDDAIRHIEEKHGIEVNEYTLASIREGSDFTHYWHIGTEQEADAETVSRDLDQYLKDANKNYGVARTRMLKKVVVHLVHPSVFYDWNAFSKKKGGQVKTERLMQEERYREWRSFVEEHAAVKAS